LGIAYGREKKNSLALQCYRMAAKLGNKNAQDFLERMNKNWQGKLTINKSHKNDKKLKFKKGYYCFFLLLLQSV